MTIGIYLLRFKDCRGVYIGQSLRIEERFTKHKHNLANNNANYKMLEAFNLYGMPTLEVLVECGIDENLDIYENEAIEIFDSVENGLNIRSKASGGGEGLNGINHGNSIYTENEIISVFKYLLSRSTSFLEISKNTCVSVDTVRDISKGRSHKWLKKLFPEDYELLLSLKGNREKNTSKDQGKIFTIFDVNNVEHQVNNLSEFARIHNLNKSHLSSVLNGLRKSHKGWKLNKN